MPSFPNTQALLQAFLSEAVSPAGPLRMQAVGGGSINETYRIGWGDRRYFGKLNSASKFPQLFQKEKAGLRLLSSQGILRTPDVVACGEKNGRQVLLLEWIEPGERTKNFWQTFGERLARLHRVSAPFFGLTEDNYMGSVPQSNRRHPTWPRFFWEERLQPLLALCRHHLSGTHVGRFETLAARLEEIFADEPPSLVHGDLWSGNFLCSTDGEPVLIDPAVAFGHRSVDLGMTTLFGGFPPPFYDAYRYHFPLPANDEEQRAVCNLYPLLVHLYLFGRSYLAPVEKTLERFA